MPNLSIKDVPEAWAEVLRQRAARNHRSLQGELMLVLEQAVHAGESGSQGMSPARQPPSRTQLPNPGLAWIRQLAA